MMGSSRVSEDYTKILIQPHQSEEQEFLDSLRAPDHDDGYQNLSLAVEGTCQWIYNSEAYQQSHYLQQGLLCIQGEPGSGKSTLLRSMVESQIQAAAYPGEDMLVMRHFFDGSGTSAQKSFVGFLRSLLHQIFSQKPHVLQSMHSFRRMQDGQFDLSLLHLREVFLEALAGLGAEQYSTYLFIDAVNESDEFSADPDVCLDFLESCISEAQSEYLPLHIYVTIQTSTGFQLRPNFGFDVRMEGHINDDIERYVYEKMTQSSITTADLRRLTSAVSQASSGNFLSSNIRSSFALNELANGVTCKEVVRELQKLPASLDDLMTELVSRIDPRYKDESLKMFQCFLACQRPLNPRELLAAIGRLDLDPDSQCFEPRLRSRTAGLLNIHQKSDSARKKDSNGFVVPIHPVVKDFLRTLRAENVFNHSSEQISMVDMGHDQLLLASLRVLLEFMPDYVRRRGLLRPYQDTPLNLRWQVPRRDLHRRTQFFKATGLLLYAVEYIFAHIAAIPHSPSSQQAIIELSQDDKEEPDKNKNSKVDLLEMWGHLQNYIHSLDIYGSSTTLLHVLSRLDMAAPLKELLEQDGYCQVATKENETILHWAAFFGSRNAAEVILTNSQDDATIEEERAAHILKYGSEKRFLLFNKDSEGRTALHLASSQGRIEIVRLLTSNFRNFQAELHSQSYRKSQGYQSTFSPQQLAFAEDFVNMRDLDGNTALHLAVMNGQLPVVEHLLQQGADWKVLNRDKQTAETLATTLEESTDPADLEESLKSIVLLLQAAESAAPNLAAFPVPGAKQVDRMFEITKIHISRLPSRAQLSVSGFINGLASFPEIDTPNRGARASGFDWIHIPANNMRWIELVMLETFKKQQINDYRSARDNVLRRELWADRQNHGSSRSGISFMKPLCHVIPGRKERGANSLVNSRGKLGETFVLFMPYIHWETEERQSDLALFTLCKHLLDSDPSKRQALAAQLLSEKEEALRISAEKEPAARELLESLETFSESDDNKRLVEALQRYLSAFPKDGDKRLIKAYGKDDHPLHIRRTLDQSSYHMLESTSLRNNDQVLSRYGKRLGKKPLIMMVDQLWLWVTKDAVISSFPRKKKRSRHDPDVLDTTDIFESVYQKISTARSPAHLSNIIIKECTGLFFDSTRHLEEDFRFLEVFADSISKVADKEAKYHESFLQNLNDKSGVDSADIRQEYELLREMKDIREELQMIAKVLRKQQRVLDQGTKFQHNDVVDLVSEDYESIEQNLQKIDSMILQATATCSSINELIDLRQNYANLSEAQSARKQAEETAKQGNTIMVFTIVTILFLPASFMTSFFALPLRIYENSGSDKLGLTYVVKWIMIFTIPLAILLIYLAFYINPIIEFLYRWGTERASAGGSTKTLKSRNSKDHIDERLNVRKSAGIIDHEDGSVWARPRTWFRNRSRNDSSAA